MCLFCSHFQFPWIFIFVQDFKENILQRYLWTFTWICVWKTSRIHITKIGIILLWFYFLFPFSLFFFAHFLYFFRVPYLPLFLRVRHAPLSNFGDRPVIWINHKSVIINSPLIFSDLWLSLFFFFFSLLFLLFLFLFIIFKIHNNHSEELKKKSKSSNHSQITISKPFGMNI